MKKIIINDYNLKDEDMTEIVRRVKVLLINSKSEILLGYSHNTYQFPGGHVEQNETLIETLNREIKEETGIDLNIKDAKPFACNIGYYKDYPKKGNNRKIEIYYYEIKNDNKPNLESTQYTEEEKKGNFRLKYIPFSDVERVLVDNSEMYGDEYGIEKEMLMLLKIYKKEYKK